VLRTNVTNVYGVLEFYKQLAAGKYPELLDDPFLTKYNKPADPNAKPAAVKTIPCDGNGCNGVMQQHASNVDMWTCSICGRCVLKSAIVARPMSRKEYFDAQGQATRSGFSRGIFGRFGRSG
jgi:hypothetical protein